MKHVIRSTPTESIFFDDVEKLVILVLHNYDEEDDFFKYEINEAERLFLAQEETEKVLAIIRKNKIKNLIKTSGK